MRWLAFVWVVGLLAPTGCVSFPDSEKGEESSGTGDTSADTGAEPDTLEPDVAAPDVVEPDTDQPDVGDPDVAADVADGSEEILEDVAEADASEDAGTTGEDGPVEDVPDPEDAPDVPEEPDVPVCVDSDCDDGGACTTGSCDDQGGCVYTPNIGACDDGVDCTTADTCVDGQCSGQTWQGCAAYGNVGGFDAAPDGTGLNFNNAQSDWVASGVSAIWGPIIEATTSPARFTLLAMDPGSWTLSPAAGEEADLFPMGGRLTASGLVRATGSGVVTVGLSDGGTVLPLLEVTGLDAGWHPFDAWVIQIDGVAAEARASADGGATWAEPVALWPLGSQWTLLFEGLVVDDETSAGLRLHAFETCLDSGCDDTLGCTADVCTASGCVSANVAALCDDGDACTDGDVCSAGVCAGQAKDCDDSKSCTLDTCTGGSCAHDAQPSGTACDDADPCTIGGSCIITGACLSTSNICGDQRLSTAASIPLNGDVALSSLFGGGYLAAWSDNQGDLHTRATDSAGTRQETEAEEIGSCTGCFRAVARLESGLIVRAYNDAGTIHVDKLLPDGLTILQSATISPQWELQSAAPGDSIAARAHLLPLGLDSFALVVSWGLIGNQLYFSHFDANFSGTALTAIQDGKTIPDFSGGLGTHPNDNAATTRADGDLALLWANPVKSLNLLATHAASDGSEIACTDEALDAHTAGNIHSMAVATLPDDTLVAAWTKAGDLIVTLRGGTDLAWMASLAVAPTTTGTQTMGAIGVFSDGGYVLTWTDTQADGNGDGIYARIYDSLSVAEGPAFRINETTAGDQHTPRLVVLDDDEFVVSFVGADGALWTRRLDRMGLPVAPVPEFSLSSTGTQQSDLRMADFDGQALAVFIADDAIHSTSLTGMAGVPGGPTLLSSIAIQPASGPTVATHGAHAVAAWVSHAFDEDRIYMSFRPVGGDWGPETLAWSDTEPSRDPSVATTPSLMTMLVWRRGYNLGDHISARVFTAEGTPTGGSNDITSAGVGAAVLGPAVVAGPDETFVIGYQHRPTAATDDDLQLTKRNATWDALGTVWLTQAEQMQRQLRLAVSQGAAAPRIMACWESGDHPDGDVGVRCRLLAYDTLAPAAAEFDPTSLAGPGREPSAAWVGDEGVVVAWHSKDADGAGSGILARRYDYDGNALGAPFTPGIHWSGDQVRPTVHPLGEQLLFGWESVQNATQSTLLLRLID